MKWIDINDKKPPTPRRKNAILICAISEHGLQIKEIDIAYYDHSRYCWIDYFFKKPVIFSHWMPLPQLP